MLILFQDIVLRPDQPAHDIAGIIAGRAGVAPGFAYRLVRRSLDARDKRHIVWRCRVAAELPDEVARELLRNDLAQPYREETLPAPGRLRPELRALVVGAGPAGLFCAIRLVEHGVRVEIIERGKPVEERLQDIRVLEESGTLDEESNVLFGEGGAGMYSDGKLTTRINHPALGWFFAKLVEFGAPESILHESQPHVGTDRLRAVLIAIRRFLREKGVVFHFNEKVTDLMIERGRVEGLVSASGKEFRGDVAVLAIGHSARDTYDLLHRRNITLEKKGFAVGTRIEHPAEVIRSIQYGDSPYRDMLPSPSYALTWNNRNSGRGVYSFCMCPGGSVINSSSEQGRLCTNGMSFAARDGVFSNAAIVVTVRPEDVADHPLAGIALQREIEEGAFRAGGGGFYAPAQRVSSFLENRIDRSLPRTSFPRGVRPASLDGFLPPWLARELRAAFPYFNNRMRGFTAGDAVLIGAETRTSSPVRIVRGEDLQSRSVAGLYPAGEGAGYAGGITSSAIDGFRAAEKIIEAQGNSA